MKFDDLIVGAGFAGSVLAERLAQAGRSVLLIDRRGHVAGNAYDELDEVGVLVHRYGPHAFHTNSRRVFQYLSRFTEWRPYEYRALTSVDGKLLPFPINLDTVNGVLGLSMTPTEAEAHFERMREPMDRCKSAEDVVVASIGRELFEKFFRGYTRKQWGVEASELDASVTARVMARTTRDDRYFTDTYQAMPRDGYTAMFLRMLEHPRIRVELGATVGELGRSVQWRRMIFTGPVDEFFSFRFGPLPYRSLRFRFETANVERLQPAACIHHPNEHDHTRVTEFKHLTGQSHPKTTVAYEIPTAEGEPYYPVPSPAARALYERYRELAEATPGVHFTGRLATYRYYNMDQVVAQSLTLFDRLAGARTRTRPARAAGRSVNASVRCMLPME